jgi:predicted tellurium resistance membrane protein TerC
MMALDVLSADFWASLFTLTILEIILGIDNVIFISIVADKLPPDRREKARRIGLLLALFVRLALLAGAVWLIGLTRPLFAVFDFAVSIRDLILFGGGLFLIVKGTKEIHVTVEGEDGEDGGGAKRLSFANVIGQIVMLDIVFSFDSIVTAIGLTDHLPVMWIAVVLSMIVMLVASAMVAAFIREHPTVKMLALSFLLLIGVALVADGLHFHIPRGYLYFAVAFSLGVEALNLVASRRRRETERPKGDR